MRTATFFALLPVVAALWGVPSGRTPTFGFVVPNVGPARRSHKALFFHKLSRAQPQSAPLWRVFMSEPATEAEAPAPAEEVKAEAGEKRRGGNRTPLSDIQVGQELTGKVKGVQKFGVFVDIGAQSDGLVHISQMSKNFVSDPNELAKIGDTVSVRVLSVDTDKKQIALSMKPVDDGEDSKSSGPSERRQRKKEAEGEEGEELPGSDDVVDEEEEKERTIGAGLKDVSEFVDYDPRVWISGKITSIQDYGAFVKIGKSQVEGLLPKSDSQGTLKVGQELQIRITEVDTELGRIALSNQPLLRGKRTRFAQSHDESYDKAGSSDTGVLYLSEMPNEAYGQPDNDADWYAAFDWKGQAAGGGQGFTEGGAEGEGSFGDDVGGDDYFGEEEPDIELDTNPASEEDEEESQVEDEAEFNMGSIEVYRSPAFKRERGFLTDEEEVPVSGSDYMDAKMEGIVGGAFSGEYDENDPEFQAAFFADEAEDFDEDADMNAPIPDEYLSLYASDIPELTEAELKDLRKSAMGTRRNLTEEWLEQLAEESAFLTTEFRLNGRKAKDATLKALGETEYDKVQMGTKFSIPIYFSKKMPKLKQVELLEELEKLAASDPLDITGQTQPPIPEFSSKY